MHFLKHLDHLLTKPSFERTNEFFPPNHVVKQFKSHDNNLVAINTDGGSEPEKTCTVFTFCPRLLQVVFKPFRSLGELVVLSPHIQTFNELTNI
jgi:hypothetical protein